MNQTAREGGKSGTGECEKDAVFPEAKETRPVTGHKDEDTTKLLLLTRNTSQSKIKTNFCCVSTMFHEPGLDTFIL